MVTDWTVQCEDAHITLWEEQYTSYMGNELVGQSTRLEVVIACLAEKASYLIAYHNYWKISRSIGTSEKHTSAKERAYAHYKSLARAPQHIYEREMYGDFKS